MLNLNKRSNGGFIMSKQKRESEKASHKIAEENYKNEHEQGDTQFEKGLAETHEQVSDDYHEGTIDRKLGKED
ncbi:YozQ family protein [Alkalibacillus haloalkaliphilus]|uniref:YozQ family protein n=1 Tax=Alkalibacillus haloalkaliphilus TaxID=94136 RepID=UPI0029363DC3|nr:YozQ family protein [Alkalibacillus haloalkaliphilus]MDV2582958.1 YozQ family protein [Alkalibacillus haloalkaliphilus]